MDELMVLEENSEIVRKSEGVVCGNWLGIRIEAGRDREN
jgi:hypothetical protein